MAGPLSTGNGAHSNLPPDQREIAQTITDLDAEIATLRARFDQYFLGLEKKNPIKELEDLRKRILTVKGQFIRNTGLKFRVQSLYSKLQSYERLWLKSLKEMEEGTYRRDIFRLRRKNQRADEQKAKKPAAAPDEERKPRPDSYSLEDLEADLPDELFGADQPAAAAARKPAPPPPPPAAAAARPAAPPPAPAAARPPAQPAAPAGARPPPPPAGARLTMPRTATGSIPLAINPASVPPARPRPAAGGELPLSKDKMDQLYNAYITAKRRCKESTAGITPEALAQSLRRQVPVLMKEHGAKSVDFKVVIKDGKAVLKAVPK